MIRRILAFVLIFLANIGLARGQSVDQPPFIAQPNLAGKNGPILAEDAEAAEALEASGRPPRMWGRAEFLLWWLKAPNVPTLVTLGDFNDLPAPGALDAPGTTVLFGGDRISYQDRAGGRFSAGYWLDDEQRMSVEAGYFFLTGRTIARSADSPGNPVLATPFFNVNTGIQDASLVTFPGIASGSVTADTRSYLQGVDLSVAASLRPSERVRVAALAGFRWVNLNETIDINSTSLVQIAPQFAGMGLPFDGNTIRVSDHFGIDNHFYGGQVGARVELTRKRFTLDLVGKVAIGVTHEVASVRGFTGIDTTPATAVAAGLYALSSNSGRHASDVFAVVPETGATLKFQLTERIGLFGGYSFIYWSRVARPGDQIDFNINTNLVPTSAAFGAGGVSQPAFHFRQTDFFAHGANFGFEFRY